MGKRFSERIKDHLPYKLFVVETSKWLINQPHMFRLLESFLSNTIEWSSQPIVLNLTQKHLSYIELYIIHNGADISLNVFIEINVRFIFVDRILVFRDKYLSSFRSGSWAQSILSWWNRIPTTRTLRLCSARFCAGLRTKLGLLFTHATMFAARCWSDGDIHFVADSG
jgi:hypothetical protein